MNLMCCCFWGFWYHDFAEYIALLLVLQARLTTFLDFSLSLETPFPQMLCDVVLEKNRQAPYHGVVWAICEPIRVETQMKTIKVFK